MKGRGGKMRRFIKVKRMIAVMLMIILFTSCRMANQAPDSSEVSDNSNSIYGVRSSLEKKVKEYFENNEESLTILAKAFLSTNYSSIKFHTDSVEIWEKGSKPYEISKDALDQDLYLYYSLVDPPFHEIHRINSENSHYASTEYARIVMEYQGVSGNSVTIQALLCYGDNLAQSWTVPEEYTEKISEDWMIFFNYHEGIIRMSRGRFS